MIFKHESVELGTWDLVQDNSGPERVYRRGDSEYASVTSWIGTLDPDGAKVLDAWRDAVGHAEAHRITKTAADKGTALHLAAEQFLSNEPVTPVGIFYAHDWKSFKRHLEENVNNIFALEHRMYSDRLGLAGTVDCIGEYRGKFSIIDFKTSNRVKYLCDIDSYWLQCATYGLFLRERYKRMPEQLVIIMQIEGDPCPTVFVQDFLPWARKVAQLRIKNGK